MEQYIDDVLSGRQVACKLVKQACKRYLSDIKKGPARGLYFDEEAAVKSINFFRYLRHSKGEWAGQPFILAPWQQFNNWNLFGWYRADGTRRFRKVYEEVARKNGKSTWAGGIGNYLAFADNEQGAEVYAAATKKDQARIVHGEASRMVRASPELLEKLIVLKDSITRLDKNQTFVPLGADEDTLDGLNPHAAIVDELHAHKTSGVYDKIETAMGARRNPVLFAITTAGVDRLSICYSLHQYSVGILNGDFEDDETFCFIATLDEKDRWDNPAVWVKANPNLGISVKPEYLEGMAKKAKRLPAFLNSFLRLHMNVWTQQVKRWIDLDLWDANAGGPVKESALEHQPCYGGLDLSSVSDIAALALGFPMAQGRIDWLFRLWCPEDKLQEDSHQLWQQYRLWRDQGYLITTPGNAIDYKFIKAEILALAQRFELRELSVDRLFQGYQLSMELQEEGMTVVGMGMGFLSMAGPSRELDRLLLGKKIHHGGHPVLRWMAGNCATREDPAGNIKPDKAESQGKIDGIVAMLCALDRIMRQNNTPSVYEERGLLAFGTEKAQDAKNAEPTTNGKPQ